MRISLPGCFLDRKSSWALRDVGQGIGFGYDGPNLVAFKVPKSVLEGFVVLKGAAGTKQLQRLGNLLTADNVKCSIDGARTESRDESAPRTAT